MGLPPPPSKYQQAILDELAGSSDHLAILATAGAGKTTVLTQISRSLPPDSRQMFLAFARDAAGELKKRLPATVDTRTVHSLGRQIVQRALQNRNVRLLPPQPAKYRRLAARMLKEREPGLASADAGRFLVELASAVRLQLVEPDDVGGLRRLVEELGLWAPCSSAEVDKLFQLVPDLIGLGLEQADRGSLDFVDMLFVPVRKKLPVPPFDLVCVDEAQDYSPLALELTMSLASAGARLVFVGDPRQCIFGFAGADPDAMKLIADRLAAKVLPLSVTYRCPRLHVELARELAPEIEAAPTAESGTVQVISDEELLAWARPGDLVLCRLNAPLLAACMRFSEAGLPAFVRGADLLERLLALAARVFREDHADRLLQLDLFEQAELRRLSSSELQAPGSLMERVADECACLRHVVKALDSGASRAEVEQSVTRAFGGGGSSLVLSTIHRAKGQEADRVLLLYPELLPAPYARSLRALRGESCVQFVALTRARRDLILVEGTPNEGRPAPVAERSGVLESAELERDRMLAAWQSVLFKARAGRRHRAIA